MADQLNASITLINDKVKFRGEARTNPEVIIDYTPPVGDGEGYTSLELLLLSLASCCGTALLVLLRKMRKDVSRLAIHASGRRREQHPTGFEEITLAIRLVSKDAEDADLERALQISEESICPVWNMLKGSVVIRCESTIVRE